MMYQSSKIFVRENLKAANLILENPNLLMVVEHFGIELPLQNKTVAAVCRENGIRPELFTAVCNLYNGFTIANPSDFTTEDIPVIIRFLRASHSYYKNEKYPEIMQYIHRLHDTQSSEETELVEKFFTEYFGEVTEHLEYEENEAFPAICGLMNRQEDLNGEAGTIHYYQDHHSDIESKLADLKNLLLKHLHLKGAIKRKLLYSLIELEFDLSIHSRLEDEVLVPLVLSLEKNRSND